MDDVSRADETGGGLVRHGSLLSYPNKDSLIEQLLLTSLVKRGDFPLVWGFNLLPLMFEERC